MAGSLEYHLAQGGGEPAAPSQGDRPESTISFDEDDVRAAAAGRAAS